MGGWSKADLAIHYMKLKARPEDVPDIPEMSESDIESACTKLLEDDGWRPLRTDPVSDRGRGKGFGEKGMADHLYLRYEHDDPTWDSPHPKYYPWAEVIWIEYKSADGKLRKNQGPWHEIERSRGALTLIAGVDFPASVAGFVEWYRKSGLNRGRA